MSLKRIEIIFGCLLSQFSFLNIVHIVKFPYTVSVSLILEVRRCLAFEIVCKQNSIGKSVTMSQSKFW